MAKIKVKLNSAGVRELLKSSEMQAILEAKATQIAQSAGSGYEIDRYTGVNRVNVGIYPATKAARSDNFRNNTLLKAVN